MFSRFLSRMWGAERVVVLYSSISLEKTTIEVLKLGLFAV